MGFLGFVGAPGPGGGTLTINTTPIVGGNDNSILFDNVGTVGENTNFIFAHTTEQIGFGTNSPQAKMDVLDNNNNLGARSVMQVSGNSTDTHVPSFNFGIVTFINSTTSVTPTCALFAFDDTTIPANQYGAASVNCYFPSHSSGAAATVRGELTFNTRADTGVSLKEMIRMDSNKHIIMSAWKFGSHQVIDTVSSALQILTDGTPWFVSTIAYANSAAGTEMALAKTRSTTVGSFTTVQNGDALGTIWFYGDEGSKLAEAANIGAVVDGTPAANSMPTSLSFNINTGPSGPIETLRLTSLKSVVVGNAAAATSATDGFLYIPSCAGTPSGTPTTFTGRVPMIYDTTNNKFYIYNGGWKGGTNPGAFT